MANHFCAGTRLLPDGTRDVFVGKGSSSGGMTPVESVCPVGDAASFGGVHRSSLNERCNETLDTIRAHQPGKPYVSNEVALAIESMPDGGWLINPDFFERRRDDTERIEILRKGLKGASVTEHAALLSPTVWSEVRSDFEKRVREARELFERTPNAPAEAFQEILLRSVAYQLMPIIPPPPQVVAVRNAEGTEKPTLLVTGLEFDFRGKGENGAPEGLENKGYRQLEIKWKGLSSPTIGQIAKRIEYAVRVHTKTSDTLTTGLTTSVVTMSCGRATWVLASAPSELFVNEFGVERKEVTGVLRDHGITFVRRAGRDSNAVWIPRAIKDLVQRPELAKSEEERVQLTDVATKILPPLHFTVPFELLGLVHPTLLSKRGFEAVRKCLRDEGCLVVR